MTDNLPPLPEPMAAMNGCSFDFYTDWQMELYAAQAVRLEHERLLNLSKAMINNDIGAILEACQLKSGLPAKEGSHG